MYKKLMYGLTIIIAFLTFFGISKKPVIELPQSTINRGKTNKEVYKNEQGKANVSIKKNVDLNNLKQFKFVRSYFGGSDVLVTVPPSNYINIKGIKIYLEPEKVFRFANYYDDFCNFENMLEIDSESSGVLNITLSPISNLELKSFVFDTGEYLENAENFNQKELLNSLNCVDNYSKEHQGPTIKPYIGNDEIYSENTNDISAINACRSLLSENNDFCKPLTYRPYTSSLNNAEKVYTDDHPITWILPRLLFESTGESYNIGTSWGYYKNTYEDSTSLDLLTDVIVFEIIQEKFTNYNNADMVKIEPVITGKFCLSAAYDCLFYDSKTEIGLTNFSVGTILSYYQDPYDLNSEKHLNTSDPGYDLVEDNGYFISRVQFAQTGNKVDSYNYLVDDINKISEISSVISEVLKVISYFDPTNISSVVSEVLDLSSEIGSFISKLFDELDIGKMYKLSEKQSTMAFTQSKGSNINSFEEIKKGFLEKNESNFNSKASYLKEAFVSSRINNTSDFSNAVIVGRTGSEMSYITSFSYPESEINKGYNLCVSHILSFDVVDISKIDAKNTSQKVEDITLHSFQSAWCYGASNRIKPKQISINEGELNQVSFGAAEEEKYSAVFTPKTSGLFNFKLVDYPANTSLKVKDDKNNVLYEQNSGINPDYDILWPSYDIGENNKARDGDYSTFINVPELMNLGTNLSLISGRKYIVEVFCLQVKLTGAYQSGKAKLLITRNNAITSNPPYTENVYYAKEANKTNQTELTYKFVPKVSGVYWITNFDFYSELNSRKVSFLIYDSQLNLIGKSRTTIAALLPYWETYLEKNTEYTIVVNIPSASEYVTRVTLSDSSLPSHMELANANTENYWLTIDFSTKTAFDFVLDLEAIYTDVTFKSCFSFEPASRTMVELSLNDINGQNVISYYGTSGTTQDITLSRGHIYVLSVSFSKRSIIADCTYHISFQEN